MTIKKNGECVEAKGKWERQRAIERDFCLDHCPHPNARDCRWTPKLCMAEVKRGAAL